MAAGGIGSRGSTAGCERAGCTVPVWGGTAPMGAERVGSAAAARGTPSPASVPNVVGLEPQVCGPWIKLGLTPLDYPLLVVRKHQRACSGRHVHSQVLRVEPGLGDVAVTRVGDANEEPLASEVGPTRDLVHRDGDAEISHLVDLQLRCQSPLKVRVSAEEKCPLLCGDLPSERNQQTLMAYSPISCPRGSKEVSACLL